MPLYMVECAHTSAAGARCSFADRSMLMSSAYECPECGEFFHPEHHHERPSGRPTQYCADCDTYHPPCVFVHECRYCGSQTCGNNHQDITNPQWEGLPGQHRYIAARVDSSHFHGSMRSVMLDFRGDAGTHPLAMGPRYIGLEIEVENGGHFDLPMRYGIVGDGSLSNGLEILTPPSRGDALVETVKLAMDKLALAGYESTERCGLHTHIDLRDRRSDPRFLSRLFALGFAVEDILFSLQKRDRHLSHYSIPLRNQYAFYCAKGPYSPDFEYVYNKMEKSRSARRMLNAARQSKWGDRRYLGFNFHSVFHRGTLEVRIHEGTLDADRILQWADLVQAIVARAETKVSYRELLAIMNTKTKGVKIERMQRALNLSEANTRYIESFSRPKLIEIPFGLDTPPRPLYL